MKRRMSRDNFFAILDVLKFGLLLILLLMFVNFNVRIARQGDETKAIAASTNSLVRNQKNILDAIAQVTTDTKITAAQQTAIIICMLQVPIGQRTTDLQQQCRAQAANFVQNEVSGNGTGTTQNSTGAIPGSSSNNTTGNKPSQSNNSQNPPADNPAPTGPPDPSLLDRLLRDPIKNIVNFVL